MAFRRTEDRTSEQLTSPNLPLQQSCLKKFGCQECNCSYKASIVTLLLWNMLVGSVHVCIIYGSFVVFLGDGKNTIFLYNETSE